MHAILKWQTNLTNGHLSDCQFLVGRNDSASDDDEEDDWEIYRESLSSTPMDENANIKLFYCHKMVLATASEVFERQFYGEFKDQPSPICLTDISPDSFRILLEYIYTSQLVASDVNLKTIPELLYLSEKYMMSDFSSKCIEIVKKLKWNIDEILPLFDISCLYSNLQFMLLCYEKIRPHSEKLLDHYTFFQLNPKNLKRVAVFLNQQRTIKSSVILEALEKYGIVNGICQTCNMDDLQFLIDAAMSLRFDNELEAGTSYLLKLGRLGMAE